MKSHRLVLCLTCGALIAGCSDDAGNSRRGSGSGSVARWSQWGGEPAKVEADSREKHRRQDQPAPTLSWKNWFKQETPASKPPESSAPATRKVEAATKKKPLPQRAVAGTGKEIVTQEKPLPRPADDTTAKFTVKEQPPVLSVKRVAVKPPKMKRVAGIDWHVSLPAALKEASQGDGKPVLCFRVLGDLSGFM